MAHCLLSLDVKGVSVEQRRVFYAGLCDQEWEKFEDVDTTWAKVCREDLTEFKRQLGTMLKDAAKAAKAEHVSFVVQVGDRTPCVGEVRKVEGVYRFNIE